MEDDKRKKKNRKKKNKQKQTAEDGVAVAEESATRNQNLVNNGKDNHNQLSEATDEQSTNVDLNGQPPNGKECVAMQPVEVKGGKQQGLESEAILEERIRNLKEENDVHIQKEVKSEETIRKLKEENQMHIQKEVTLQETINQLQTKNELQAKEQVNLLETINQLRTENELQAKGKATLEMRIGQLLSEKDSLLHIKAGLENKTNELQNEKSVLNLKGESLQDRINHLERDMPFSFEKEKSAKETISKLNGDISRLRLQVAELEEYRNIVLVENQQLKEIISGLQSKVQNLENSSFTSYSLNASAKDFASENEDLKSKIEAAHVLVEKLVAENAELVEKVNELYVELELDRRSAEVELSGGTETDGSVEFTKPANEAVPMPESGEIISKSARDLNHLEESPAKDKSTAIDAKHATKAISTSSFVSEDSGEIVQIPLDDNEVRSPQLQAAQNAENDEVPITDAPLIGAPFRLISFVANYVSGADLVSQSS